MLIHPQIDPVALNIGPLFGFGPLQVHWYGLTYLAAFALFYGLATWRLKQQPFATVSGRGAWTSRDIEDILFLGVMGVILGGRIGYCLFYKPAYYAAHPLEILAIWQGGMSFHGGMLGVIVSQIWFAFSRHKPFLQVMDFIAPCVPTGLAMGRIGNFINAELPGRLADPTLPWAMVFPTVGALPRHPSQVYQFLLEGLLLFGLLWWFARKERQPGRVAAAFLIGYGLLRFIAEFFREPDAHLGYLSLGLSMGQWLCVPMLLGGVLLWFWKSKSAGKPA
jgi:phosphatidylglycerol---prolipoprotein diacylglyceryl transferase